MTTRNNYKKKKLMTFLFLLKIINITLTKKIESGKKWVFNYGYNKKYSNDSSLRKKN